MSARNLLSLYLVMATLMYLLFRPDLLEIAVFLLADLMMFPVIIFLDRKFMQRLMPASRLWFQEINWPAFQNMDDSQQGSILQQLMAYPRHRANLFACLAMMKMIPTFGVVLFYFHHDNSMWLHAATFLVPALLTVVYGYAVVFLDNHKAASQLIADLHNRFDWSRSISSLRVSKSSKSLAWNDKLVLLSVTFLSIVIEMTVVLDLNSYSKSMFALALSWVGGGSMLLIFNYLQSSRSFVYGALDRVFAAFDSYEPRSSLKPVLPIHSLDILARFEQAYNQLSVKLRQNEVELTRHVYDQSEKHRFRTLGEVAALVVHDIANPIHSIGYCADAMTSNDNPSKNTRYLDIVTQNVERVKALLQSLRAFLKREGSDSTCNVIEAHSNVLSLLATQFNTSNFERIQFKVDPRLGSYDVRFNMSEMIHVLLNLYSNAIKNFIANGIVDAKIELSLCQSSSAFLEFIVRDNGTGLSPEDFKQLTGYGFYAPTADSGVGKQGLGLRLTCRLVEQFGGELRIDEAHYNAGKRGTVFHLQIPLRQPMPEEDIKWMESRSN